MRLFNLLKIMLGLQAGRFNYGNGIFHKRSNYSFGWLLTTRYRLGIISFIGARVAQEDVPCVNRSQRTLCIYS
jgi:hypothetical protein